MGSIVTVSASDSHPNGHNLISLNFVTTNPFDFQGFLLRKDVEKSLDKKKKRRAPSQCLCTCHMNGHIFKVALLARHAAEFADGADHVDHRPRSPLPLMVIRSDLWWHHSEERPCISLRFTYSCGHKSEWHSNCHFDFYVIRSKVYLLSNMKSF